MLKIALFNHKGGVGKTTLTVNIADALEDMGKRVLIADADPQCNATSFYMTERDLEGLLEKSDEIGSGATLWSAVKPVVEGSGDIGPVTPRKVSTKTWLLPGDVMLSEYEEELPTAWTECFARRARGYAVMTALSRAVQRAGDAVQADVCLYDAGPNVGALNRAVLLDCDYFITPVAADLFSLRALSTVGRSLAKWIRDWQTVRELAGPEERARLFMGRPRYMGYITSAYKVNTGRNAANPHAEWERKIAPRVRDRIIADLRAVDPALVPPTKVGNKIGGVKHFQSLAAESQHNGLAIGQLRGHVNPGHNLTIADARATFQAIAREVAVRTGL